MAVINLSLQASVTQQQVVALLAYDRKTGIFTHRHDRGTGPCKVFAGQVAGTVRPNGYRYISIGNRRFLAHRLAIFYVKGCWPEHEVDHRDGNRDNNKWRNLRMATTTQNRQNMRRKCGASGLVGARLRWDKKRWISAIKVDGKALHLGNFPTAEEAHAAYVAAKARLHTFQPTVPVPA